MEPAFFDQYIKNGNIFEKETRKTIVNQVFLLDHCQVMMHSLDANLNSDNVVVLNPNGKFYLSLVKNTYETFGIEGIKRTKADVKHDKHIIMIDFKSPNFKAGSNQFNRLKWCLENTLTSTFKMVFCATDACKFGMDFFYNFC